MALLRAAAAAAAAPSTGAPSNAPVGRERRRRARGTWCRRVATAVAVVLALAAAVGVAHVRADEGAADAAQTVAAVDAGAPAVEAAPPPEAPPQPPAEAPPQQPPAEAPPQPPVEAPQQPRAEAPPQPPAEAPSQQPAEAPPQPPAEAQPQPPVEAPAAASEERALTAAVVDEAAAAAAAAAVEAAAAAAGPRIRKRANPRRPSLENPWEAREGGAGGGRHSAEEEASEAAAAAAAAAAAGSEASDSEPVAGRRTDGQEWDPHAVTPPTPDDYYGVGTTWRDAVDPAAFQPSHILQFAVPPGEEVTLYEEVGQDTVGKRVRGDWFVTEGDELALEVSIADPDGLVLYLEGPTSAPAMTEDGYLDAAPLSEGAFNLALPAAGVYTIRFMNPSGSSPRVVAFAWLVGRDDDDPLGRMLNDPAATTPVNATAATIALMTAVSHLHKRLDDLSSAQQFADVRFRRHLATIESSQSRIGTYTLLESAAMLLSVAAVIVFFRHLDFKARSFLPT